MELYSDRRSAHDCAVWNTTVPQLHKEDTQLRCKLLKEKEEILSNLY